MSIYDNLGQQNMLQQLKANPQAMLAQRGLSVPQGMSDPRQILNHLMQTGQVSNPRLQAVMQMLGRR